MKYLGSRKTDLRQINTWSFARTSLNARVKGRGHQGKMAFFDPFGGLLAIYVW